MKRFNNILLVLDPEEEQQPALARAAELVRLNQASLTIMVLLVEPPLELRVVMTSSQYADMLDKIEQLQRARTEILLAPLRERDLKLHLTLERHPIPSVAIIRAVLRQRHDLVIKTARRVTGPGAVLFHPTERQLMRKCPCPVWMVKQESQPDYKRIVAAVNPFPDDVTNNDLNEHILHLASSLAMQEGAELHVVHAHQQYDAVTLEHLGVETSGIGQQALEACRQRLDQLLAAQSPVAKRHTHLLLGVPTDEIVQFVEAEAAELIVMGTVARAGIPGLLMGNTAERILDQVHCDVLAIKPTGFITPVTLPKE